MDNEIRYISEAFSMQPVTIEVKSLEYYENTKKYNNIDYANSLCAKIVFEISPTIASRLCVGYNFEGKKLFQYLESSVNIGFKV